MLLLAVPAVPAAREARAPEDPLAATSPAPSPSPSHRHRQRLQSIAKVNGGKPVIIASSVEYPRTWSGLPEWRSAGVQEFRGGSGPGIDKNATNEFY